MSNLVEILVTAKNLTGPTMAAVNAEVNKAGKGMAMFHKTAMLAGAGLAVAGVEAVKMASKFDSEMTLLHTQAGVANDQMDTLKKGVLSLAGKVGQDPDSLAESLFHVESNFESMGITSKKALALTETAAKGATTGHADLVDVTNALTAAVASGIPGVQNFDQAMGVLNATVGVGDMKMSDLAAAFGSGMVATVKGFGLSITDVGAALAVFGDNNIRGALAGNQLRMSVMALAQNVKGGEGALRSIGLETDTLAKDMQKGGLKLALEDLVAHMKAAGISSKEQGALITEAFGRKAGAGLNILVGQIGRLESKYPALTEGAKNFSQSWEDTKKTFAFQLKSLETGFEALMIGIGQKIIPPLQAFIGFLKEHKSATIGATEAMGGLLAAAVAVSVALKAAAGAKLVWGGITTGAAAARGAFETTALKMMYMRDASVAAGGGIRGLGAAFGALSTGAKLGLTVAAVAGVVIALKELSGIGKAAPPDIDRMTTSLGELGRTGKESGELVRVYGDNLKSLSDAFGTLNSGAANNGAIQFLDKVSSGFGLFGKGDIQDAKDKVDDFDKALAALASNGHADLARVALDKAAAAGKHFDPKKLDDYNAALDGMKLQTDLTAQSEGKFGAQAQKVQAQLDLQAQSAKGLMDSLQALDQVNQDAYNSETKFYDAVGSATQALKDNGKTLNVHTDKGRANRDALSGIAAATDDYTEKLVKQKSSWDTVNAAYGQGYDSLVKSARGFGLSQAAAEKLADSLLHVPEEVKVAGDISDLQAKLKSAKGQLGSVPKSKRAALLANIADLEAKIAEAKQLLASLTGKTVTVTTKYVTMGGAQAAAGNPYFRASGGPVSGPGTGTSDSVPIMASDGEFVVNAKATAANRGLLEAINGGRHGVAAFAKGGHVTKAQKAAADRAKAQAQAEAQARGDAFGQFGISHFGQMAGYRTSPFTRATGDPGDIGSLVSTLNDWRSRIAAATHGAQESKLLHALDRFGARALKNEAALEKVNTQLDGAKNKLGALKDSFAQLKDGIAASIVSFGSIAKSGGAGPLGNVSVAEQLRQSVGSAQAFASDLAALKKKGLNAQSLSEIANAGIEGGGLETAQRLLGSNPGQIREINDLEKQLIAAGKAAGTTTAGAMYGAGIKAADGLVEGLEKSQKRIEGVMAAAADAMARELKRALGTGRKGTGGVVGAAATGGARWGRTLVGEYGPEIADLPAGTMVHSAGDSARMLASGGASAAPTNVTIVIGDREIGRVVIDPLRREIRNQGGNVQAVLGVRGK